MMSVVCCFFMLQVAWREDYVGDFVREDAGELGFSFGGLDGSQVDEDGAAGESEGVYVRAGDYVEGVRPFEAGGMFCQVCA